MSEYSHSGPYLWLVLWTVLTFAGLWGYYLIKSRPLLLVGPLVGILAAVKELWFHQRGGHTLDVGVFFLITLSLVHLLLLMMLDKHATDNRTKVMNSCSMLLTGWAYFAENPLIFALLWTLSILPQLLSFTPEQQRPRRVFYLHHACSVLALLIALALLHPSDGQWSMSSMGMGISFTKQVWGLVCLVLAAFIRQGIFPFHLWFKAGFKTKPFPLNIGFYLGNLGFFLFVHSILPFMEARLAAGSVIILSWGVLSGLYFANMSLVQNKLRSSVFYVMLAQFSILFCGLETGGLTGKTGVLFQFLTLGLAFGGLVSCLYLLEWNLGELSHRRFHGLQVQNPILAVFFLLFALCAVAMPLSMGFVGEDLIFHAVVESYPWIGLGLIVVAAINGISLLKVVTYLFRGSRPSEMDDHIALALWQKAALGVILLVLFGFGLYPDLLLRHVLDFV